MIKKALEKIGLTEGEIQVYTALLELGLTSTGSITKKAHIASSKVYEVLDRLMQKGLASYIIKNGVKYFDATPPERLLDFLEEKKESIDEAQSTIHKIIPQIKLKRKLAKEENKTVVYYGKQGPRIVLNELLESAKKGISHEGFGTNVDPYVLYLARDLHKYIKEAKKYKFKTRLIFAEGFASPNTTAQVRYLPKDFASPVRTMIYGNKVAIADFTKPWTTIIINKKEVADAYRKHFNFLWKIAKK